MINILVTGSDGFIGKNLCSHLSEKGKYNIFKFGKKNTLPELYNLLDKAEIIFHLAGANRPKNNLEFYETNTNFTKKIISYLDQNNLSPSIVFTSSTQASQLNDYGKSKLQAEKIIESYSKKANTDCFCLRLPNIFGKWSRPNYNSVVATFCHNAANNIESKIDDAEAKISLMYIDDLCEIFINYIDSTDSTVIEDLKPIYKISVGEIHQSIESFKSSRENLVMPNVGTGFLRALYSTYLSYIPKANFKYQLDENIDDRGIFCEFLKTEQSGQFSFFTAKKGITRGGHYHHSKNEKFLVLKGEAKFRFKNLVTDEYFELFTSDKKYEVVETIPGWTHDITNISEDDLIVMLWANEIFNPQKPDTFARSME